MKKPNFKGLHKNEKLKTRDIQVQFNMSDDVYQCCALYNSIHMSLVESHLASSRVLRRVAKRFAFQAKDSGWRGATTRSERDVYRSIAKHLKDKARRKSGD